jgi:hypothetical protein
MKEAHEGSKKKSAKKSPTGSRSRKSASTESASTVSKALDAKNDAAANKDVGKTLETRKATAPATEGAPRTPIVDEQPTLPATRGKVNVFGGPKDRGIKPTDKLALPTGPHGVYELVRTLNPKSFYCAMRWNYHVEHMSPEEVKRWWANKKLLVTNASNGNAVVVRAVDYGPHENTGLDIGISPGAAEALGVEIGGEVDIALADPKSALGPAQ